MKKQLIAAAVIVGGMLALSGCVASQTGGSDDPKVITVPESLTPTNVPDPVQKVDAACASSWVKFERLLTQYDAESARLAADAQVEFNPDDPFDIPRDAAGAADYYAGLSTLTVTFGTELVAVADSVTNPQVTEVIDEIADGHIDAGEFLAVYADPATSDYDIADFEDDYFETYAAMSQYASLCGETLTGGTSDS